MSRADESSHFAFQELVALARADGKIASGERKTLERFAKHLGISSAKAERYLRVSRRATARGDYPKTPERRIDLLAMLARVAYSDGELQEAERRYFERLCDEFDVPRTRLARILEEAEFKAERHGHLDKRWLCAAVLLVSVTAALLTFYAYRQPDEMTGFKVVDEACREALVLVHTRYTLEHDKHEDLRFAATGTGFFVSSDGLVLTNKHVVQPWRFQGLALDRIAQGYRLRPSSVRRLAWREGSVVLDARRQPRSDTAYATRASTLRLVALAPDAETPLRLRPEHLRIDGLFCHRNDDGDLALLRCRVDRKVASIPLAPASSQVHRLDPVLVLGYPRGLHLLETSRATSTPTVGRVRKTEATIFVTAPIVSGNSGGPLMDTDGRVIGIATRTFGSATLAACLRVEHAHALLARAPK